MKASHVFSTVETHTGGQPTRTITGGLPHLPGSTITEKMIHLRDHMDWVRTALMFEPRGSAIMSGVVLTEPCRPEADIGVIFIETGGYLPMCGHDTIGVSTMLVETGMVEVTEPETRIVLDTPGGLTRVRVRVENGRAQSVTFRNIPCFVMAEDVQVDVPGLGILTLSVSYGGNVYAILPAGDVGLGIRPDQAGRVIELGARIRQAVNAQVPLQHPEIDFINECTHVEFHEPSSDPGISCRNTVFFATSGIDRSPCGTGTSARVALMYSKGQLALNEEFVHQSIIGSIFRAKVVEETTVGRIPAVVPEVTGQAHIMSMSQIILDPEDPHRHGFLIGG